MDSYKINESYIDKKTLVNKINDIYNVVKNTKVVQHGAS